MPDYAYEIAETTLEPGETVILYTDGVTDAMNAAGERLGDAAFQQAITSAGRAPRPPAKRSSRPFSATSPIAPSSTTSPWSAWPASEGVSADLPRFTPDRPYTLGEAAGSEMVTNKTLEQARTLKSKGRLAEAETLYRQVLQSHPDTVLAPRGSRSAGVPARPSRRSRDIVREGRGRAASVGTVAPTSVRHYESTAGSTKRSPSSTTPRNLIPRGAGI